MPFIQIEPFRISLAAIVAGVYDTYLETFATSVASYGAKTGHAVIIGFGHEMNGYLVPVGIPAHVARRCSWPPGGTSSPCSGSRAPTT